MLLFVLKAIKQPQGVVPEDMEALHEIGWGHQDISDAVVLAAVQVRPTLSLMRSSSKTINPHFSRTMTREILIRTILNP